MPDDWDEHHDVAAGASCPMPDCGGLAVAYRSADAWDGTIPSHGSSRVRAAESTYRAGR